MKNKQKKIKINPSCKLFIIILTTIALLITSLNLYIFPNKAYSLSEISALVDKPIDKIKLDFIPDMKSNHGDLPLLRAIQANPEDPSLLKFHFDTKDKKNLSSKELNRMIRYFLGFLAIPKEYLWVNLSPYEDKRIIPEAIANLDIGKDMLIEDYLLKQLTAAITNPKYQFAKNFWRKIKEARYIIAKTNNLPIDNFYKVWIVPKEALVYQYNQSLFIKEAKLKVLMDDDYQALSKNNTTTSKTKSNLKEILNKEAKKIFKQELLPIIEKQVNFSKDFAPLRQIYYAFILASAFKKTIKNSLLINYQDGKKTSSISSNYLSIKNLIYTDYVKSFKSGVYKTPKKKNTIF